MTEFHDDTELRSAFRDLADTASPYVRPPGAAPALRAARSRIRTRRLVVSAAAALAILVPAGVIALYRANGPSTFPQPPATVPVTTDPTPTDPEPTGSPPPTSEPTPEVQPITGPGDLLGTTLSLSWPNASVNERCGGRVTIVEGSADVMVLKTMNFDVDGDGSREIVAQIFCVMAQSGPTLLVAIQPDRQSPTILGTVLATVWDEGPVDPDSRGPVTIQGFVGLGDGTIRVDVGNRFTCCGTPRESAVVQQRTYGWTGSAFAQVGGPTTFVADPTVADLEVTVPTLAFSAPAGGFRTATLSVTIHNKGPQTATDVSVYLEHQFRIEPPSGGDWDRCAEDGQVSTVCQLGDIGPGQTVALTLPMRRSTEFEAEENPHFSTYPGKVEVRTGAFYYPPVEYGLTAG